MPARCSPKSSGNWGPVPAENTPIHKIDLLTIWSLIILGGLLIAGFFTRISALLAAGMVLSFYLVNPPWPGMPPQIGPEHSYIINKNFIEVMALLALTFLPTGSWFGVDGIFRRLVLRQKSRDQNRSPKSTEKTKPAQPVAAST